MVHLASRVSGEVCAGWAAGCQNYGSVGSAVWQKHGAHASPGTLTSSPTSPPANHTGPAFLHTDERAGYASVVCSGHCKEGTRHCTVYRTLPPSLTAVRSPRRQPTAAAGTGLGPPPPSLCLNPRKGRAQGCQIEAGRGRAPTCGEEGGDGHRGKGESGAGPSPPGV